MKKEFYLPRYLLSGRDVYTEEQVLEKSRYIVVLAEPGGGKTEVLGSLAYRLNTSPERATVIQHCGVSKESCPMVIDGFDEVAKIDEQGIYKIFSKIKEHNPTHVLISSRSSEWNRGSTHAFSDFFGESPLVVRLREFNEAEQRQLFDHHLKNEDFGKFQNEVARFDLKALLSNPQFLKLFANAYIQGGRKFENKISIFSQAIDYLAIETNERISNNLSTLTTAQKIDYASEVFAKILLSGVEGVATTEPSADKAYPLLGSLLRTNVRDGALLATRLFLPGEKPGSHRAVHKIVAEYCAAHFLVKRITSSSDPLTLSQCLVVIAPNSSVRKELRGLFGWMISLGNRSIQEQLIPLDPYSALANGDASLLEVASKKQLIKCLEKLEKDDPYFRGEDFYRKFGVASFFTSEMIKDIRLLISLPGSGQLRGLILELLVESPFASEFLEDLQRILLDSHEIASARLQCGRCQAIINSEHFDENLQALIVEASAVSLEVAGVHMRLKWGSSIHLEQIATYLLACSTLYGDSEKADAARRQGRYFVRGFIEALGEETIENTLTRLVESLQCKCQENYFYCNCLVGLSKVVGMLLDRYFELRSESYNSESIWKWVRDLRYNGAPAITTPKSVEVLQNNIALRNEIIVHAFYNVTDIGIIRELKMKIFESAGTAHAGLRFNLHDRRAVAELAFHTDNPNLWSSFFPHHVFSTNDDGHGPNLFRQQMRAHARQKPEFMRVWVSANKRAKKQRIDSRLPIERKLARKSRLQSRLSEENRVKQIRWIEQHKARLEIGNDWDWLEKFARFIKHSPARIVSEFGDTKLVQNSLINSIPFLLEAASDSALRNIARARANSTVTRLESILYSACMEVFRATGTLQSVDNRLLRIFRAGLSISYPGIPVELRDAVKKETDRLLFTDEIKIENFLREEVEAQFERPDASPSLLWIMSSDAIFSNARAKLPIAWLRQYPYLSLSITDELFELAARHSEKNSLDELIQQRCDWFLTRQSASENSQDAELRNFWYLRGWFFLDKPAEALWQRLKQEKKIIFKLADHTTRSFFPEFAHWPKFNVSKVELILNEFAGEWAAVDLPESKTISGETAEAAYHFLKQCLWSLNSVDSELVVPVLDRFLSNPEMSVLNNDIKSIRSTQLKTRSLRDFQPPTAAEVVKILDQNEIVSVGGMRQLILDELSSYQAELYGGEFNSVKRFYEGRQRLGEIRSAEVIEERLSLVLKPKDISVVPEHHLKDSNRCDFTATKMLSGRRHLLVVEVKGQWHKDLYSAASAQLFDRYSIHPDAEQQGIYLVLWFGAQELVAERKTHGLLSALELKHDIEAKMPANLRGLVDVFVLDVSR